MRYLQVERAADFRLLAEENRINVRLLPPERGLIFDRNGVLLAGNEQNYRITLVREDTDDVDAVLGELARIVNLDLAALERAREEIMRRPPFVPVTVADRLSWEELSSVAVNAPGPARREPGGGAQPGLPAGRGFRPCGRLCGAGLGLLHRTDRRHRPGPADPRFPGRPLQCRSPDGSRTARSRGHQAGRGQRRRPRDARAGPQRG
jgi:hypothetical protein